MKHKVKNVQGVKNEIEIHSGLDHPNIVKIFETFEDPKSFYLVLELCAGGDLLSRVAAEPSFTESLCATLMQQMLRAINYLHQNDIAFRDLKPENWLFLDQTPIETTPLKLVDFGEAMKKKNGTMSMRAGKAMFTAPEVLTG